MTNSTCLRTFSPIVLALSSLLLANSGLEAAAVLKKHEVKPSIVVAGPRVDASCLIGKNPPEILRKQLEKIPIGVISKPLGELQLNREELEKQLGAFSDHLEIPRKVKILRKGDLLPKKELISRIRTICLERSDDPEHVQIDDSRLPERIVLPGSLKSWDIQPISTNTYGMVLLNLNIECDSGKVKQIVQVEVSRVIRAAKVVRLLKKGEIITEKDVEMETVRVKSFAQKDLAKFDNIIGKQTISIKSPGSYLKIQDVANEITSAHIQASPSRKGTSCSKASWTIKPGERVQFHVQSGSLRLSVPAKALEGGCVGDSIRLVNLQNNRNIFGTISGEGRVDYATK
jgi:flagella basal body P-ring formation protein FlgA